MIGALEGERKITYMTFLIKFYLKAIIIKMNKHI